MPLTSEQLDLLTREDLLALFKTLLAEVESLRQRVAELETENERLKRQSTNSDNSSRPPSRDQKINRPEKKRRQHGPPFGHAKYSRPLQPDRVISAPVTACQQSQADLTAATPDDI